MVCPHSKINVPCPFLVLYINEALSLWVLRRVATTRASGDDWIPDEHGAEISVTAD